MRRVTFRATTFKNKAEKLTARLRELIDKSILQTGEKEEYCQKICLLNALNHLDHTISGVEDIDIKEG
ncbi:MAG: hypothetical protein Q7J35_12665 [Candidatus Methanoperedens sp.]|nr:hypothetical protein [Candidatus Methanoperedens sp.]